MSTSRRRLKDLALLVPFAAGIATAAVLWGDRAPRLFYASATEVIALGVVAMALDGRMFRIHRSSRNRGIARATLLVSVGTGLGFAFGALARADGGGDPHLALTAGALAMGAAHVAIQAFFGLEEEA